MQLSMPSPTPSIGAGLPGTLCQVASRCTGMLFVESTLQGEAARLSPPADEARSKAHLYEPPLRSTSTLVYPENSTLVMQDEHKSGLDLLMPWEQQNTQSPASSTKLSSTIAATTLKEWAELVEEKHGFLGAAQELITKRQHLQAANLLLLVMTARSRRLLKESHSCKEDGPTSFNESLQAAASQPVPAAAFGTLVKCVASLHTVAEADSLLPQLQHAQAAATEASSGMQLQLACAYAHLLKELRMDSSLACVSEAERTHALKVITQGNWLTSLELSHHMELSWLNAAQAQLPSEEPPSAKAAHLLHQVLSRPTLCAATFIPTIHTLAAAEGPMSAGVNQVRDVLSTCSQWLDSALAAVNGFQHGLGLSELEKQQVLLIETHYGLDAQLAGEEDSSAASAGLGPASMSLDHASYVWSTFMQPPADSGNEGIQGRLGLPRHAARQTVLCTLAWDMWRKLQAVVIMPTLRALHAYMSALQSPHQLSSVTAVKAHVMPLLLCVRLFQQLDRLHTFRRLDKAGQPPSKRRRGAAASSNTMLVTAAAEQQAAEYREVACYLQGVITALVGTTGLLPAHVPNLFSELVSSFKEDLWQATSAGVAGTNLQQQENTFSLDPLKVFKAGHPHWQGANFTCWWSLTMLQHRHAVARSKICQVGNPPQGSDINLYLLDYTQQYKCVRETRHQKQYMLPEELLSAVTECMKLHHEFRMHAIDKAVTDILSYIAHAVQAQQSVPATTPCPHLALEPWLLLLEVVACTLTLALADSPDPGIEAQQGPRAYLPSACKDLLLGIPYWGVNNMDELGSVLQYWQVISKDEVHGLVGLLLDQLLTFAKLLANPGPVLSTMAQHQVLAVCASHASKKSAAPPVPCLGSSAQQMRAALLALRLARVVACMLLTIQSSTTTGAVTEGKNGKDAAQFCPLLRQVLCILLPVLQNAPAPESQELHAGVNEFNQYAEHVTGILGASMLSDLLSYVSALAQYGLMEVTTGAACAYAADYSPSWKQITVRTLHREAVQHMLQTLQIHGKRVSCVSLRIDLVSNEAVTNIAPELPTAGAVWSAEKGTSAHNITSYIDLLDVADRLGILSCVTALELAGVELSTPLPGRIALTCPNLTSLKLRDCGVGYVRPSDDESRAGFPQLHTLSFSNVALQGPYSGCWEKQLRKQVSNLTALTSLSLEGQTPEPGAEGMGNCWNPYKTITLAVQPAVASQLTQLKLKWGEDDPVGMLKAWKHACLAHHLKAVQVLHLHMPVDDGLMEKLLGLPCLRHLGCMRFTGELSFAGQPCQWHTVQCSQLDVCDLEWLPLHARLVIKNPPGERMKLVVRTGSHTADTVASALASIKDIKWCGWHNNQVEVHVSLKDKDTEAAMVQALPLLEGISQLHISGDANQSCLSRRFFLALARFVARQGPGFHLELNASCTWEDPDIWELVASMPTGSHLTVYDEVETPFIMLCLFTATRMTLQAKTSTPPEADFLARLESSLARLNRQSDTATVRQVPGKPGKEAPWELVVTMKAPADGGQQFLMEQRSIMQHMMAEAGPAKASGSPGHAPVSTAVDGQEMSTSLRGAGDGAVSMQVCQPISDVEVLPLMDCPKAFLWQMLGTLDSASLLAIFQSCVMFRDDALFHTDSITLQSHLLEPQAAGLMLTALERASQHSSCVSLILNMLQQAAPAAREIISNQPHAGDDGDLEQLHAEEGMSVQGSDEAMSVQGSDEDTGSDAGSDAEQQLWPIWPSLLETGASMGILHCITKLELVGAELIVPLPTAVAQTCPNLAIFKLQSSTVRMGEATADDFKGTLPRLRALTLRDVKCHGESSDWLTELRQQVEQLTALTSVSLIDSLAHSGQGEYEYGELYSLFLHAMDKPTVASQLTHLQAWWDEDDQFYPNMAWEVSDIGKHLKSVHRLSVATSVTNDIMECLLGLNSLRHLEVISFAGLTGSFTNHECRWQTVQCHNIAVRDLARLPLHANMVIKAVEGFPMKLRLEAEPPVDDAHANIQQRQWAGWKATPVKMDVWLQKPGDEALIKQSLRVCAGVTHLSIRGHALSSRTLHALGSFAASQAQGVHVELLSDPELRAADMLPLVSRMPGGSQLTVHGIDEVSFIHLCMSAQSSITICAKSSSPGHPGLLECIKSTLALWGQQIAEASISLVGAAGHNKAAWEWLVTVHEPDQRTQLHILELYGDILDACMPTSAAQP